MTPPQQLLFLPGASGNTRFWQPVAERLRHAAERHHFGWPGFGPTPADPQVRGLDDLAGRVAARIDRPSALVAQSMGGIVALKAALARPGLVTHLVLAATSGGIDVQALGAEDWRPMFVKANPSVPDWFVRDRSDLSGALASLGMPVLLLWGDADPISPVAVGRRLAELLPDAALHLLAGGGHDAACTHAEQAAPLIEAHLARG